MLYEFRSLATGSVTMTGEAGSRILAVIGKSADPKGIIAVAQLPAAIAALEAAVAAEKAGLAEAPAAAPRTGVSKRQDADDGNDDDDDDPPVEPVSLAQRAWPLLDLFRRALAADKDVTWGV